MSRTVLLASAALATFLATSPAAARNSWGKPNIGFAEYRIDAEQCSNAAFDAPLWIEPIEHVIRASYAADVDIFSYARARMIMVHGVTVTIADQLQAAVDHCLIDRGYTRFRLSDAQDRQLSRFHRGTIDRAHFLHSLGSDPAVMAAQAIRTVRPPEAPASEGKPARNEPPRIIQLLPPRV